MNIQTILDHLQNTYADLTVKASWGETAVFLNPGNRLPSGVYFVTLKEADGPNDKASMLGREGVFRLNLGVSKASFRQRFGEIPIRPTKGGIVQTGHDFTALDQILPHPVYGWMSWICVLNPSPATLTDLYPLLDESYELAKKKVEKRLRD